MTDLLEAGWSLLATHERELELLGALSLVTLVASVGLIPLLVAWLPANYFSEHRETANPYRHPVLHATILCMKNALGAVLLIAGIAMLVLPGQGLLTILAAIVLLDFPGKRRLERRLISYEPLRRAADRMRRWRGRPPFEL